MRPPQGNYGVGTKANWENKHHLLNLLLIWTFSFLLWLPLVAYKQGERGWGSRERDSGLRGGGDPHVFTRVRFCSRNDREEVGLNHSKNLTPPPPSSSSPQPHHSSCTASTHDYRSKGRSSPLAEHVCVCLEKVGGKAMGNRAEAATLV